MIDLLKIQTAVWALTAGTAAGLYSVRLYRKMPACWVCDDGEDLRTEHMPSMRIYLNRKETAAVPICIAAVYLILLKGQGSFFCTPAAAAGCILSLTALSAAAQADSTYLILPDQPTLFILTAGLLRGLSCDLAALLPQKPYSLIFFDADAGRVSNAPDITDQVFLQPSIPILPCAADAAAGALIGFLIMMICASLSLLISDRQGIGMGDVKLIGACGSLVGQDRLLILLLFSSFGVAISSLKDIMNRQCVSDIQKLAGLWIFASAALCLLLE